MSRILVTGGTGFIGRHAVEQLAKNGHEIHVISRSLSSSPHYHIHQADILDQAQVRPIIQDVKADSLLHLAWETEHGAYWHSDRNFDHLSATLNLARAFRQAGGKRFVGAGTCAEYDWSTNNTAVPLLEAGAKTKPHTLYGTAKLSAFQLLQSYAQREGLQCAWGRLFLLYGEGEQKQRLAPDVIINLLKGQPVKCSSGTQIRDFMHAADAGHAFAALLESKISGPVNIATGQAIKLSDFVNKIATIIGRPDLVQLGALDDRPDDPGRLEPDISRLRDEVGFQQTKTMEQRLTSLIGWWREELGLAQQES